jgi:hypothetical protein
MIHRRSPTTAFTAQWEKRLDGRWADIGSLPVPADEEVSLTMENVQEESMDGSSIVGGLMPVESSALTTETEASVRPSRTLREHAERE